VLGPRQCEARPHFGKDGRGANDGSPGDNENRNRRIHARKRYSDTLTDS
jgi:hypothetical protein